MATNIESADLEVSTSEYAARFSGGIGRWMLKTQEKITLDLLKQEKGASVLEIGGGHGQLVTPLYQHGIDLTVLSSDEKGGQLIHDKINQGQCKFLVGNPLDLPLADNTFDVVLSYRFMAHISDWRQLLNEMTRVSKNAIIIDYPRQLACLSTTSISYKLKKYFEGDTRPYSSFPDSTLDDHLSSIGMNLVERKAQFIWPMVAHRVVKSPGVSTAMEKPFKMLGITDKYGSPCVAKYSKR